MTLADFRKILDKSGFPVAYLSFPAERCPAMPFITYQETGSDNFSADGKVYKRVRTLQVDLFTKNKQPAAEEALEAAFDDAEIFWNKFQTVDDNESCQRYTYEIEVIGG